MERLVRTFVGLRVGAAARRRLHARALALKALDPALRVPEAADLHLTLHFLGDTLQTDLVRIGRALEEAAAGIPPLEITYRGLGAFPDASRARVAWIGVVPAEGTQDALGRLAHRVGATLDGLGYPPERRRFHAHVTLARTRRRPRQELVRALEEGATLDLGGEILSELKLILSDPGSRPYHYIDLTTVELEDRDPTGDGAGRPGDGT